MNKPRKSHAWSEVGGILLIGVGLLLFLALVSFDKGDIPPDVPLIGSSSDANDSIQNFIGVIGAVFAGYMYFFFGIASFWFAVLLTALGFGTLFVSGFQLLERAGWALLNVISAACILQLFPGIFENWKDHFNAHGTGGFIGHYLGQRAFGQALGAVGSLLVLLMLYFSSLILATGFHPIHFCKRSWKAFSAWKEERRKQRLAALDEKQKLAEQQKELEEKAARLERKLKKTKKDTGAIPKEEPSETGIEEPPPPKIIDASVPPEKPSGTKKEAAADPLLSSLHLEDYTLPGLDLLDDHDLGASKPADPEELKYIQDVILETLAQFGIDAKPGDITKGPTITRYELYPPKGVRVDKISALERDIARATKAERINILAPIPGKDTVGIEIANSRKVKVILKELFETDAWTHSKARLPVALGKDVYGNTIVGDLAAMPHCLVAGTTGSGKSVCINAIVASLLYRHSPEDLRFIMIDPKVVELQMFNALPHLVTPVVTDPKKVLLALRWVIEEMENRYRIFARVSVRNIGGFNARPKPKTRAELDAEAEAEAETQDEQGPEAEGGEVDSIENAAMEEPAPKMTVPRDEDLIIPDRLPYIVVIIDELADLMQTAPADVEAAIARITQMARAAGIHMIVATQTPRADVVTGIIKANIPSRIAFQVNSKIDSRVILDENGAEKLLGQGDMLYLPPGTSKFTRSQGVLVTDEEMRRIVDFVAAQGGTNFESSIQDKLETGGQVGEDVTEEEEELVSRCLEIIKQEKRASTSMLQRRLRLGYSRAARVVDVLEQRGILGPRDGAKDREILVDLDQL